MIELSLNSCNLGEHFSYSERIQKVLQKFFRGTWSQKFSSKKFLSKIWKRNFAEKFSRFTVHFGSKNVETFFSKCLKKFSNGRMTLIFSFRHPFNLIVWGCEKIVTLKCVKRKITQKKQTPPPAGRGVFIFNVFLTRFGAVCFKQKNSNFKLL